MAKKKILGHVGDVNPVEHWGGVVYDAGHGPHLLYFQSYDGEGETMVSVYDFPIDNFRRDDWYEWDAIASYIGWSEIAFELDLDIDMELKDYVLTLDCEKHPMKCAWFYESIGSYHGFGELDHYPNEMTLEDAEDLYEDYTE